MSVDWKALCLDKRFDDLPFKIELNGRGQIIMSPTKNKHGYYANRIARILEQLRPDGEVIVGCAVDTADGTKEADVAWLSKELFDRVKDEYSCPVAPEVCVEVMSASNSEGEMLQKKDLSLRAGAREYWLCDEWGQLRFFDARGELGESKFCPGAPAMIKEK